MIITAFTDDSEFIIVHDSQTHERLELIPEVDTDTMRAKTYKTNEDGKINFPLELEDYPNEVYLIDSRTKDKFVILLDDETDLQNI